MKAEVLSLTEHIEFPLVAAVLFVTIFLGAVWRVLRPGARAESLARARLAFEVGELGAEVGEAGGEVGRAASGPRAEAEGRA